MSQEQKLLRILRAAEVASSYQGDPIPKTHLRELRIALAAYIRFANNWTLTESRKLADSVIREWLRS